MFPNAKGSELLSVLATIDPASQAAGAASTVWVPVANYFGFLVQVQTGVLGTSATVDAKLQQALDSIGTDGARLGDELGVGIGGGVLVFHETVWHFESTKLGRFFNFFSFC